MGYVKLALAFLAGLVEAVPIIANLWTRYSDRRREKVALDRLEEKTQRNASAVRDALPPVVLPDGMHDGKDGQRTKTDPAG